MWGNDGWTAVRYRRGRLDRRPPQPYQGRGAGSGRGKDRAPPVPYWGQAPFPPPNLPVPPAGWNWYPGPQRRSYATVVMGGRAQTRPFTSSNRGADGARIRQQPADPAFGQLVRKLHTVIKTVHHLQNVAPKSGKAEPRMISRMVQNLASMIKPALPTATTADLIWGNAKNWGYNTLLVLERHYQDSLETTLESLEDLLTPDWRSAFEVATRWARRNLSRITQEVIDHAEALITTRVGEKEGAPAPSNEPVASKHTTRTTQDAQQQTTTIQQAKDTHTSPQHQTKDSHTSPQRPTDAQSLVSPPVIIQDQSPLGQPRTVSVGSMTDQFSPGPSTPSGGPLSFDSGSLTPQRTSRPAQDWQISPSPDLLDLTGGDQSPILIPQRPQGNQSTSGLTTDSSQSGVSHSTPKPQCFRVTRHPNSYRKMIDWDLQANKKWLIVGDSNLARIPRYPIEDLQIDSYPGANFRHAQALLSKAKSQAMVEKLVLSFGINCRGQRAKETAVKQMQAAVRTAKKKFPCAEIWVPVINFSTSLSAAEQVTLQILNGHIKRNMPFIPALPSSVFRTEKDDIHWTRNTACAMLDHWLTFLNWNAPQASSRRGIGAQNP